MSTQYFCSNKDRAKIIQSRKTVNGIDYLEVTPGNQKELKIYFLLDLPGQPGGIPAAPVLQRENIFIEGGVRIQSITVVSAVASGKLLTVTVNEAGDFSTYTLKIGNSNTDQDNPPPGFDQQLSSIDFSFKIDCPNEFDCKTEEDCPPALADEPAINYLAKDFSSFNRLMLDRLSVIMPNWKERNAADQQVALVELLAYVGDHLSYYQDAVATESYLHTARKRISLKRHARLLDYYAHDGCNARVWAYIEVEENGNADTSILEKGTVLMTAGDGEKIMLQPEQLERFITEKDPVVFETMHDIVLNSAHNSISFYTWGDTNCCLPKGAVKATLRDNLQIDSPLSSPLSPPVLQAVSLKKGDVLVFEELYSPETGTRADADRSHRHAVRLKKVEPGLLDNLTGESIINIEWYEEDALPFSLCLTSAVANEDDAMLSVNEKSVARGNIVLADHGLTVKNAGLVPSAATEDETYYPRLGAVNNTVCMEYDHALAKSKPASAMLVQEAHQSLPVITLNYDQQSWSPVKDLLGSDRFATEFVAEMEQDGITYLRFGDDIAGKRPVDGFEPSVTCRTGNGNEGNIGAETLNTIIWIGGGISNVRNPLPAAGGKDAETMEEIRQFAPQAFRTQERAVTAEDYVQKTELHPEVQKAAAKFYWTGSWYTVYIIIDRKGGLEVDDEFKEEIRLHLEQYRMAGYDLEIRPPRFVPLHIVLFICVKEGYLRSEVKKNLLRVFSNTVAGGNTKGFFHPDNFTFGQPLYLSAVYKTAMEIAGVGSVDVQLFKRWTGLQGNEIYEGVLKSGELEILRLDNDASLPENGKIDFIMSGGL